MKFQPYDTVKIKNAKWRHSYVTNDSEQYVPIYTKEGNRADLIIVDPDEEYIVDPTRVMPTTCVFDPDGKKMYYPLLCRKDMHSKKFYVCEDYIELVNCDEDDEFNGIESPFTTIEDLKRNGEPDAGDARDFEITQACCTLQKSLAAILNETQNMLDVIQKLIDNG